MRDACRAQTLVVAQTFRLCKYTHPNDGFTCRKIAGNGYVSFKVKL